MFGHYRQRQAMNRRVVLMRNLLALPASTRCVMLFKKKVPFREYCASSMRAVFEHSDQATGEAFRQICNDTVLSAADLQLFLNHLRALFIEMMLIAIAKNCATDVSLEAHAFV